jgi:hypothetical protein
LTNGGKVTDEKILSVVRKALLDMLGETPARAVEFYVDSGLAVREPERYEKAMKELFSDGARIIIQTIERDLCALAGVEMRSWLSLSDCLMEVKGSA